jgi:hypothetical protein
MLLGEERIKFNWSLPLDTGCCRGGRSPGVDPRICFGCLLFFWAKTPGTFRVFTVLWACPGALRAVPQTPGCLFFGYLLFFGGGLPRGLKSFCMIV